MNELLAIIIACGMGLVLIDSDHILPIAIFHWFPVWLFILFLGIGLIIFKRKPKIEEVKNETKSV